MTLLAEAGALFADVTAELPVASPPGDGVAGIDLGIIHPYAVATGNKALVVSGRQLRAEERLHLADTKARARRAARRVPKKGQRGSRRWRKIRAKQRRQEARHRRRIRQAHHQAAKAVTDFAVEQKVGRLVVGDPKGITDTDAGRHQNLRLRQWRRTHLLAALRDKAEAAGIEVELVDERGTSSSCPECGAGVRANGRRFACSSCGYAGHRDVVGARNIAARGGGITRAPVRITHRRAGVAPARRDRRRHLFDAARSCPAPGRPGPTRESLVGRSPPRPPPGAGAPDSPPGSGRAPARTDEPGASPPQGLLEEH